MRHFDFKNGEMYAEDVPLSKIAADVGTPVYVYSTATFERHYRVFAESFDGITALVAYSVKANSNIAVLATLAKLGCGADVVSGGELIRALTAGVPPSKIVFSGVGKTRDEMRLALEADIRIFNVESIPELNALNQTAQDMGKIADIAFRVNPDISAGGHAKISTGKAENKFGIAWDQAEQAYNLAGKMPAIRVQGVDVHIGSQIDSLEPFQKTIEKMSGLISQLRASGHQIRSFDIGGGLGIPYGDNQKIPPHPSEYGAMVKAATQDLDVELIFEPGRMVSGNSGVLLSKVIYAKETGSRNFLIIDAAMNDLLRPALYDAYHDIEPIKAPGSDFEETLYDVVGPVCETGDTFARGRSLPQLQADDLLVFHTAGAYGSAQASQYNTRPLVPEVMVNGNDFEIIRERPSIEDILRTERLPNWLT